jgi:hypothetical protein
VSSRFIAVCPSEEKELSKTTFVSVEAGAAVQEPEAPTGPVDSALDPTATDETRRTDEIHRREVGKK